MSRPLLRGVSGGGRIIESSRDSWDSRMKDRSHSSPRGFPSFPLRFLASLLFHDGHSNKFNSSENGFGPDPTNSSAFRSRQNITLQLLKLSLVLILILAISGSFLWTISISISSRGNIFRGYRRLQEQLITDLTDIGVLSHGVTKLKEVEYCPEERENYVPCFNTSENMVLGDPDRSELERQCHHGSTNYCLVPPPKNYRIPLRWPTGRDIIWIANVRITAQEVLSSGSLTKRLMMLEEDQISFSTDTITVEGVEDYAHQIAAMIGLRNEADFLQAGIRSILDIGCGYGSFGAHLFSKQVLTMCVASYEVSGSQVQFTLERGLPAMIGSFTTKRLPYPSLSFDMLHCAQCGIEWEQKDGVFLVEADRVLKPGGYFVWTLSLTKTQKKSLHVKEKEEKWTFVRNFAENLCWEFISQQDETIVWRKTSKRNCYASRKSGVGPSICSRSHDVETPYYQPLDLCIGGTRSLRWNPIDNRKTWPSRVNMNSTELDIYGVNSEEFAEDALNWNSIVRNYWSLLSPLIFSDHPKRPGDEDPAPPFNMLRNVLDMNAKFGGFNAALLNAGKNVWVMNVVPTSGPNYLPLILDRGFVGVLHDWCEAFPTYPRTYDMLHAEGLLSLELGQHHRCTMFDIFLEMDRVLRPEGWVILRDAAHLIQTARALVTQLRWEARVVELESNSDERLLVCQKPFIKKP